MKLSLVAAALVSGASAHLCVTSPLQRGGATGAGSPAADVCALGASAPCGGAKAGSPTAAYFGGETHHIDM